MVRQAGFVDADERLSALSAAGDPLARLRERGYLAMGGQIVDATVVQTRRPRLSKDEKQTLRDGGIPSGWSQARTRQIDRDGRWAIKRGRKAPSPAGT